MERVYRFVKFNVAFALFPLLLVWGMRSLASVPSTLSDYVTELLFLGIMVSIAASANVNDALPTLRNAFAFRVIQDILRGLAVLALVLYVAYTNNEVVSTPSASMRANVTGLSAILAPVLCLIGIGVELALARIEGVKP